MFSLAIPQEPRYPQEKKTVFSGGGDWTSLPAELKIKVADFLDKPVDAANFGATNHCNKLLVANAPVWFKNGVKPPMSLPAQQAWARQMRTLSPESQQALRERNKPLDIFSESEVATFVAFVDVIDKAINRALNAAASGWFLAMHFEFERAATYARNAGVEKPPRSIKNSAYIRAMKQTAEMAFDSARCGRVGEMNVSFSHAALYAQQVGLVAPSISVEEKKAAYLQAIKNERKMALQAIADGDDIYGLQASIKKASEFAKIAGVSEPFLSVEETRSAYLAAMEKAIERGRAAEARGRFDVKKCNFSAAAEYARQAGVDPPLP